MTPALKDEVNFVNAPVIASERGIKVVESKTETSENFASLVVTRIKTSDGEHIVSGTVFGKNIPRILRINDFYLEAFPEGHNLLIKNRDVPGIIGAVTSTLGNNGYNISRMHVGQDKEKGENGVFLATDSPVTDDVLSQIKNIQDVLSVKRIDL